MAKRRGGLPRGVGLALVATALYLASPLVQAPASTSGSVGSTRMDLAETHTSTATTPQKAPRAITLETSDSIARAGTRVKLSGRMVSTAPECVQNEFVKVRRRVFGTKRFRELVSGLTDFEGVYRFDIEISRSASYIAITTGTDACKRAESSPEEVRARPRVSAKASDNPVAQGAYFRIAVSVRPSHPRTRVLLQQLTSDGFVTVDSSRLNGRSRMEFLLVAGWEGTRDFRVKWPKQHRDHEAGLSRRLAITTN